MIGTVILIIVLLLVAMALVVVEICTPIFGLLGALAVVAAAWAVYLCYTVNPVFGLIMTLAAAIGAPAYVVAVVKVLPKTRLGSLLHLGRARIPPGTGTPEADELASLVGRKTVAETVLRPSGMIRLDGRRIVAQAESGMIEKGEPVRIIRAAGNHVVVRKLDA